MIRTSRKITSVVVASTHPGQLARSPSHLRCWKHATFPPRRARCGGEDRGLPSVPINSFLKLEAFGRLPSSGRLGLIGTILRPRSRTARGSGHIRPVGHVLLGVAFLAGGWSVGGFAGSLMSCCDKTRRNSPGGPAMNVTLASAAFSPARPAGQSRAINRIHGRTIAGSCIAALICNDGKTIHS
jgi:hypothetical protein